MELLQYAGGVFETTPVPNATVQLLLTECMYTPPHDASTLVGPMRVLITLANATKSDEVRSLVTTATPRAGIDAALDFPESASGETARNEHSARVCWERYAKMHGGNAYDPERRLAPKYVGAWCKAFLTKDVASLIIDPLKPVYQMHARTESAGLPIGDGQEFVVRGVEGEQKLKAEFGKVAEVFEDILAAFEAAGSFTDTTRDGTEGMHNGVRYFFTEKGSLYLRQKLHRAMLEPGSVASLCYCVKKLQLKFLSTVVTSNVSAFAL